VHCHARLGLPLEESVMQLLVVDVNLPQLWSHLNIKRLLLSLPLEEGVMQLLVVDVNLPQLWPNLNIRQLLLTLPLK
jgi:hypothetical protein